MCSGAKRFASTNGDKCSAVVSPEAPAPIMAMRSFSSFWPVVSSFVLPLAEVEKQESDDVDADRVDCVGRREGRRRYWRW